MPFNHNFAHEEEERLIESVQQSRGCFNVNCKDPSAAKRCTRCNLAIYCSRECQMADWKDDNIPHKKLCKVYRQNVAPDTRSEGNGQKGAVAIGLFSVNLINEDQFSEAMRDRTDTFLKEAKRCLDIHLKNDKYGFRKATIGLAAALVHNMGKVRLQCAATLHDSEDEIGFGGAGTATVNHVIFEAVNDEGGDDARGPSDASLECRERIIQKLKDFFTKAHNNHGISIQSVTFGKGLMWMSEEDFRDNKRELERINGGSMIIWMPDIGNSAMGDMMNAAATGGLWGVE